MVYCDRLFLITKNIIYTTPINISERTVVAAYTAYNKPKYSI